MDSSNTGIPVKSRSYSSFVERRGKGCTSLMTMRKKLGAMCDRKAARSEEEGWFSREKIERTSVAVG